MKVTSNKTYHLQRGVDGLNPNSNHVVTGCSVTASPSELTVAHWDWLQIIPRISGYDNRQYAAALAENVVITGNDVQASGSPVQCIFSMDGRLDRILVAGNTLTTDGQHLITLGGVISGTFVDNYGHDGQLVPTILEPLRIAGDIYIMSFLDAEDEYQECQGHYEDYRRVPNRKKNGTYLYRFDLKSFLKYSLEQIPKKGGAKELVPSIRQAALSYGTTNPEGILMLKNTWKLSKEGKDLLVESEGIETDVYLDQAGLHTIGIGHLLTKKEINTGLISIGGKEFPIYHTRFTKSQIYTLFSQDVKKRELRLNGLLDDNNVVLDEQYQFDALFSLYYNIGHGAFSGSTVLKRLASKDFEGVPEAIAMWDKVKGEVSEGLVARRERTIAFWQGFGVITYDKEEVAPIVAPTVVETAPEEYHDSQWDSSTIRYIAYALIAFIGNQLVNLGWLPQGIIDKISPDIVNYVTVVAIPLLLNSAKEGRLKARKRYK